MIENQKTITISLFNREEYTRRLFWYLNQVVGIDEYRIFISVDPGNSRVESLAKNFRPLQTTVIVQEKRLGCNGNVLASIDMGFKNSNYNIHFEDDIMPAKDCLNYFEWARQFGEDNSIFTVSGYVNSNSKNYEIVYLEFDSTLQNVNKASKRCWFTPWGWATWRDRWLQIKEKWITEDPSDHKTSWDCNINNSIRNNRHEIYPHVARCQNIGAEMGAHVPSSEWHRHFQFNEFWIESLGAVVKDFVIY